MTIENLTKVLALFRSTDAHVDEEVLQAAWAELDSLREGPRKFEALSVDTIRAWVNGETVHAPDLVVELRAALAYYGADEPADRPILRPGQLPKGAR